MKILITGANGQLGKAVIKNKPKNYDLIITSKDELDISNKSACFETILFHKPDWIINCAAYTAVDKAEENKEIVFSTNTEAVGNICKVLNTYGGKLLQISTDYVFDGRNYLAYKPNDIRNPINVYGQSKFEAEKIVEEKLFSSSRGIILRTSWLIGETGDNFALKIFKRLHKNETLNIVEDQIGSPTSTFSLSSLCWQIIKESELIDSLDIPKIIHWSNAGWASWYDIAIAIRDISIERNLLKNPPDINPIKSDMYKTLAQRPKMTKLDTSQTNNYFKIPHIHWRKEIVNILDSLV